jgi:hypothetical protein
MPLSNEDILKRFARAKDRRTNWEHHWRECYEFSMPNRQGFDDRIPGGKVTDKLFDGTAPDAVDQLAASLLTQLTPPWAQWFGLTAGSLIDIPGDPELAGEISENREAAAKDVQGHFNRSNFSVEIHQCYLDLVVAGTASLLFEPAPDDARSRFTFTAIPPWAVWYEESATGALDTTFRQFEWTLDQIRERLPAASLPPNWTSAAVDNPTAKFRVLETVIPDGRGRFDYRALAVDSGMATEVATLKQSSMKGSPFINFRWTKGAGEIYGRSPVMKVLPDIKTANKVVELVLKNASIAVTGIWQADDDGVINPAAIKLVPGAIIPKAVGSSGLTPLQAPGRFDVSEIVLDRLTARIRHALLADQLAEIEANARMTATEVLERAAEMARMLGATYGRLQTELLNPLILRGWQIQIDAGDLEPVEIDGKIIDMQYLSPLARNQALENARNTTLWGDHLTAKGPRYDRHIDDRAYAEALGEMLNVPKKLLLTAKEVDTAAEDEAMDQAAKAVTLQAIEGGAGGGQPQ